MTAALPKRCVLLLVVRARWSPRAAPMMTASLQTALWASVPATVVCMCTTVIQPIPLPETVHRCHIWYTEVRVVQEAAKSWAACAPSSTTCSALQCRARRICLHLLPAYGIRALQQILLL